MEEQRAIWLAKDPFGLVKEIERDLDSHDIYHSTECAKMDAKGHVDVNLIQDDAEVNLIQDNAEDATKE